MSDSDKIAEYIELNPHRPGLDEARLKESGVPVWALIGYLPAVGGDVDRVAADYDLPVAAVEAAIAYYHQHRAIVDARVAANTWKLEHICTLPSLVWPTSISTMWYQGMWVQG